MPQSTNYMDIITNWTLEPSVKRHIYKLCRDKQSELLFISQSLEYLFFSYSLFCLIVQELCESRGGRPELSVLTSLLVSVDVKNY